MFKINFRIVDDFKELKDMDISLFDSEWQHITGFFQICFGDQKEGGYFHENALGNDEIGGELLDYWFACLLDTVSDLESITDYVAFKEIETINRWLEFRRVSDEVIINIAIDTGKCSQLLLVENNEKFIYVEPRDFKISFGELKNQIVETAQKFLDELRNLNPKLSNTKMALEVFEKIDQAKKL